MRSSVVAVSMVAMTLMLDVMVPGVLVIVCVTFG